MEKSVHIPEVRLHGIKTKIFLYQQAIIRFRLNRMVMRHWMKEREEKHLTHNVPQPIATTFGERFCAFIRRPMAAIPYQTGICLQKAQPAQSQRSIPWVAGTPTASR